MTFDVYTTNLAAVLQYDLVLSVIQGSRTDQAVSISFSVIVVDPCPSGIITTTPVTPVSYILGDPVALVPITAFTSTANAGCGSFVYTIGTYDITIFTWDPLAPSISILTLISDTVKLGSYSITVTGQ
jgi:hypothetical protein